ncbi:uncharacterized protein VTP21DRAFT_198 [Calcarisporiella thermophila]|uniref:uncharacterized protein n=1 Tax=Calcarisporiella thermophila TaxID=911321 RepID=UPI00374395E9
MATKYIGALGCAVTVPLAVLCYLYPDSAIGSDHRPDMKNARGFPLIGVLPELIQAQGHIHDIVTAAHEDFGMTWTFTALFFPRQIMTIDPRNVEYILKSNFEGFGKASDFHEKMYDLFGDGIFNVNGDTWRYQRKTASHIFNVKNFRDWFTGVFIDESRLAFKVLDDYASTGEKIDLHDLFFRFTLESFLRIGFGTSIGAMDLSREVKFAKSFDAMQSEIMLRQVLPLWNIYMAARNFVFPRSNPKPHVETVDSFASKVIQERRKAADLSSKQDLLSRFMSNTRDEHGNQLNDKQLRDIILNFIIAGRDTTAGALSWAFYCLSEHPQVVDKIYEEVKGVIKDDLDSAELYEAYKKLTYTTAVWNEVLRLFPSVPINQKCALEDTLLPDGTFVKKGDHVVWSPYAMGRSEAIWGPDAKDFNPDRWLKDEKPSAYEWPVFHAGPRTCLGQTLATIEGVLVMALFIKRYKFHIVPHQTITYNLALTLQMRYGMWMTIERRDQGEKH